ncbi:CRISPR-associated endoribonuclease Cas6 [Clostridium cibarium]|uniref:CRISPR-associated endoribonuclease Cas6 n=1 Tax=Clostridium cibarium TaxID=2762247 RepID=A0ABR8PVW7_9CLOT|nr:CRISPR-associated endoribonuclease Cas6 [Clostridium cibarium]MBD7912303.1 CRISPR-associated endoribonuclease Cas6 [Clostridium cibarium]
MKVYEIRIKLYVLQNISLESAQSTICSFIDKALVKNKDFAEFHSERKFKNYCFDSLYPLEKDKVYKEGKIYTLTLRTIDEKLVDFFSKELVNSFTEKLKALTAEKKIIPKKHIEKIYSITPMIMKNDSGYWKGKLSLEEFEKRIKENLIKKYNTFMNTKINEDFELYSGLEFKNRKPIIIKYKDIKLMGDKVSLNILENDLAQDMAYMCLGTGLSEMNSRGYGFMNYRFI